MAGGGGGQKNNCTRHMTCRTRSMRGVRVAGCTLGGGGGGAVTPPALGARKGRPGRAITGVGAGRSPGARLEGCGPGMEYGAAPEGPASLEPEPRRERRPLPAVPASVRERERGEGTNICKLTPQDGILRFTRIGREVCTPIRDGEHETVRATYAEFSWVDSGPGSRQQHHPTGSGLAYLARCRAVVG